VPDAIKEFVLGFGMSNADTVVDIAPLLFRNRKIIEKSAKHLYYVPAPVDITIDSDKTFKANIKIHPYQDTGTRDYEVSKKIYISGEDAANLKGNEVINLKELFSVKIKKEDDSLIGKIVDENGDTHLQWVSEDNFIKCSVLVSGEVVDEEGNFLKDSLRINEGYIESYASKLKEQETVQLERFGFCILDDKKNMQFIFISK
jgi:glutamyl/glutaminyl-tRNA synthetase